MNKKDNIVSLSDLEHVRLRPGVYAGDVSNSNQLLTEIFANALDMHTIGHGDLIEITVEDNGIVSVRDYGQGFSVNEVRDDGLTVLEASFSKMRSSGKFYEDGLYEGSSLGLNGMGAKICTFLSHWLEVKTYQNGRFEQIRFVEGVFDKRYVGTCSGSEHGTFISYLPNEEFFDTIHVDKKFFNKFFHNIACLCPTLTIVFNGETIKHPNGIIDLVDTTVSGTEILDSRFIMNTDTFALGLTYTTASGANFVPYVNYGVTESGPHISQLKAAITRVLNNWGKENELLKGIKGNLDGSAIQDGIVVVFNLVTKHVAYNAQVKNQITDIDTSFIKDFASKFEIWLDNNPSQGRMIIEKAIIAKKADEAAKRERERVKTKATEKKDKVFKLPTKLVDCYTKDRSKAEILITEGDSAASGLISGRDGEFQAVYPVRGKMINALKTSKEKLLANQEVNNLIQALGLELDSKTATLKYDRNKLRYDKIIACADADFDGLLIENLLFNILWYLCPDLFINGHVYSAVPPLFRITTKKNEYIYLRDNEALREYTEKHKGEKYTVNRAKGLGEQDAEELSHTLLDPETRHIVQLSVPDYGAAEIIFEDLYGKNVEPRIKFLYGC